MNINQIEHFLDVAETGSVNRSALNLYISPQGLSRSIAQLEKGLGFELFTRSNRGMVLTEDGRAFLEPARAIRMATKRFYHDVSALSAHSSSWSGESLNLQVPPLMSISENLGKILASIGREFPYLRVDVTERNSFELVPYAEGLGEELLRRTCMVATVPEYRIPAYLNNPRFCLTKICEFPMMVRVDKSHPFASRASVTRAEVARERIVSFNEPVVDEIIHRLLDEFGGPDFAFKGSVRDLLGRFPDAVLISGGRPVPAVSDNVVTVPIQDAINVHVVAITANPIPPIVRGAIECIEGVYR